MTSNWIALGALVTAMLGGMFHLGNELGEVAGKMDGLTDKMNDLDNKVDVLTERVDQIDVRLARVEQGQLNLVASVLENTGTAVAMGDEDPAPDA